MFTIQIIAMVPTIRLEHQEKENILQTSSQRDCLEKIGISSRGKLHKKIQEQNGRFLSQTSKFFPKDGELIIPSHLTLTALGSQ